MKGSFPHSCEFCRRYYPANDANNVMRGGGECWMWSRLKEGDSNENSCESFEPMDEASVIQRQMYALRAVPSENGFVMSLVDTFLHVTLVSVDCVGIADGIVSMSRKLESWRRYFSRCADEMAVAEPAGTRTKRNGDDTIGNVRSGMRRRMNTIVRGFPRNVQLAYRIPSGRGQKGVQVRIYNIDGHPHVMVQDGRPDYVPAREYCSDTGNFETASVMMTEFSDFANFIGSFISEMERRCSSME